MNDDLDNLLCERYPQLFKDRHGDKANTCMCWGFECGDGWFVLVDSLSALIAADSPKAYALQVKEKFGGLRFYLAVGSAFAEGAITMAEAVSQTMCEVCGAPAINHRDDGWVRTLCPVHGNRAFSAETLATTETATRAQNGVSIQSAQRTGGSNYAGIVPNTLVIGEAWQRLLTLLFDAIAFEVKNNAMPPVHSLAITVGISNRGNNSKNNNNSNSNNPHNQNRPPHALNIRWQGGNGQTRGMVGLICALSARVNQISGEVLS